MNKTIGALKEIDKLVKEAGRIDFLFQSISYLFYAGVGNYADSDINDLFSQIDERHNKAEKEGSILIITREYEKDLLTFAKKLSQFDLWDILLYIKKYVDIYDPLKAEEEEDIGDWDYI